MTFFEPYYQILEQICRRYEVEQLYAFGSVGTEKFNEKSDLDFLVRFLPIDLLKQGENYWLLWDELENLFSRKVDLLNDKTFSNPYFNKSVQTTKVLIYDREHQKILV